MLLGPSAKGGVKGVRAVEIGVGHARSLTSGDRGPIVPLGTRFRMGRALDLSPVTLPRPDSAPSRMLVAWLLRAGGSS